MGASGNQNKEIPIKWSELPSYNEGSVGRAWTCAVGPPNQYSLLCCYPRYKDKNLVKIYTNVHPLVKYQVTGQNDPNEILHH